MALVLSQAEIWQLIHTLSEVAMEMDDDGRDGAFDASPLKPIYDKLERAAACGRTKR